MGPLLSEMADAANPTNPLSLAGGSSAGTGRSLAECIWDFSWNDFLPTMLPGNIAMRRASCSEMELFARAHFKEIYQHDLQNSAFVWFESGDNKRRFYEYAGDFFSLSYAGKTIGMYVGNATDWSSYYLRNLSLLPEFQGQGVMRDFLIWHLKCLEQVGVDRVDSEVSVSNTPSIKGFHALGFYVVGQTLSERWGAMLQFRKILNPQCRQVFENQFCHSRPRPRAADHGGFHQPQPKEGAES